MHQKKIHETKENKRGTKGKQKPSAHANPSVLLTKQPLNQDVRDHVEMFNNNIIIRLPCLFPFLFFTYTEDLKITRGSINLYTCSQINSYCIVRLKLVALKGTRNIQHEAQQNRGY
jgi:hypothetical protein